MPSVDWMGGGVHERHRTRATGKRVERMEPRRRPGPGRSRFSVGSHVAAGRRIACVEAAGQARPRCPKCGERRWRRSRSPSQVAVRDPGERLEGHPAARVRQHRQAPGSRACCGDDLLQHSRDLSCPRGARRDLRALRRSRQHRQAPRSDIRLRAERRHRRRTRTADARHVQRQPVLRVDVRHRTRGFALERERRDEGVVRHFEHRLRRRGAARLL